MYQFQWKQNTRNCHIQIKIPEQIQVLRSYVLLLIFSLSHILLSGMPESDYTQNGNSQMFLQSVFSAHYQGIKAKLHRNFSGQIKSATISQVPSGKYYVSILVETEHTELPHTNQNTGIDLGIKELCITSDFFSFSYTSFRYARV